MEDFLESIVLFSGQNKSTNIRRFLTILRQKTRVFSLQKKYSFEYTVYNIYTTEAKSRTLSLFTKNTKV